MFPAMTVARAWQEGCDRQGKPRYSPDAAAFCLFNRYVDSFATWQLSNSEINREIGMMHGVG
jgi:hypothetical protein